MPEWEAPAKLNLSLLVARRDATGYHPLRSLAQTVDWCDLVRVDSGDDDRLTVDGADLPDGGDNLVWKGIEALTSRVGRRRPRLDMHLVKHIPVAAGLGGGSADAAAAIRATGEMVRASDEAMDAAAAATGADVPFALRGGTAWMEGRGERLTPLTGLAGFAVAVVVAAYELATPAVYRRWDEIGEPSGPEPPPRGLPPSLRELGPLRNDLTPAAQSLIPELADWARDLEDEWGRPVVMSGSGPAHFAYFADLDEAAGAVESVTVPHRGARAAGLRQSGPERTGR